MDLWTLAVQGAELASGGTRGSNPSLSGQRGLLFTTRVVKEVMSSFCLL